MSLMAVIQARKSKPSPSSPASGVLQRKFDGCRKNRPALQRSAVSSAPETVPPIVHEVLRSPGQPLDPATRAFFDPRFGHDFSRVRLHTDATAAESAREMNARAYTVGREVVFGAGRYSPGTGAGRGLLAHELVHVVQQRKADIIEMDTYANNISSVKEFTNSDNLTIQRSNNTCSIRNIRNCSDEDLLTAVCINEAGNIGDRDGKKGVINVIINRLSDPSFPNTIRGVVTQSGQFAYRRGIQLLNNSIFSDCRELAREVVGNPNDDPTLGALWFNQSCSKPCSQYCTTYLGDGSSPAHYFARRATPEERRICNRSRAKRERHCCRYRRTRITYVTFTEEEVEPIVSGSSD